MVQQTKGQFQAAEIHFQEGLSLGRAIGSPRNIGSFLIMYAALLKSEERYHEAGEMLQESLAIGKAEMDQWLIAVSLQHLSSMTVQNSSADNPEALQMIGESVSLFRELGDRWGLAISLTYLGRIYITRGQLIEARRHFLDAIRILLLSCWMYWLTLLLWRSRRGNTKQQVSSLT